MGGHGRATFITGRRGATSIEYGLIAAGIGVAIAAAVLTLGVDVTALFSRTGTTVSAVSDQGPEQMRVVASHTFANGREGWTGGELRTLAQIGTGLSLAGPQGGGRQTVHRTFELPAGTTRADVSFDMSFVDSWDNEQARIYVNGQQIGTGTFQWNRGEPTISFAPNTGITASATLTSTVRAGTWVNATRGADHTYAVQLSVANPGPTLTLGFGTTLNQGKEDESLLIGNVAVSANR